jgi:hypothetical protein
MYLLFPIKWVIEIELFIEKTKRLIIKCIRNDEDDL